MLMYSKGNWQLTLFKRHEDYVLTLATDNNVSVERGSREEMKWLFSEWVKRLRKL